MSSERGQMSNDEKIIVLKIDGWERIFISQFKIDLEFRL
jgi:hypothetical protein